MFNKTLIILLSCMFLFSFTSASDYSGHTQNLEFSVVVQSNNATACNLSYVQAPDGSFVYYDLPMTKNGLSFNITMSGGNYSQIGDTCNGISCTDGVTFEPGSVCRNVTPNGHIPTIGQYIMYSLVILLLIGFLIFSFYGVMRSIGNIRENIAWIMFYLCMSYLLSFTLSFSFWLFSKNYLYDFFLLEKIFWLMWIILGALFLPFLIGAGGYLIKKQLEILTVDEHVSQGYTREEALNMAKRPR